MKLYHSTTSPFVRKVMVSAIELGLADRIEKVPGKASPVARSTPVGQDNPLAKVPTLVTDDGTVLFDSRVICEYLDSVGGGRLFPAAGAARWQALTDQALADGMTEAALLQVYEVRLRPADKQSPSWRDGQHDKVERGLDRLEQSASHFGDPVDIGTIAVACALSYLDFRFPDLAWSTRHPTLAGWYATFAARPSMAATHLMD